MRDGAAATVFGCASVLLSYPDDSFADDVGSVGRALDALPAGRARDGLRATARWLAGMTHVEAAAAFVDTFDLRRGTSLYVTYYGYGDTRERGTALLALLDGYRRVGMGVAPGELPDYLPALLELAAVHPGGAALLAEHRTALDALHLALEQATSPYAATVAAVIVSLPRSTRADRAAFRHYMEQGPPTEEVGLEPLAPPEALGLGDGR